MKFSTLCWGSLRAQTNAPMKATKSSHFVDNRLWNWGYLCKTGTAQREGVLTTKMFTLVYELIHMSPDSHMKLLPCWGTKRYLRAYHSCLCSNMDISQFFAECCFLSSFDYCNNAVIPLYISYNMWKNNKWFSNWTERCCQRAIVTTNNPNFLFGWAIQFSVWAIMWLLQ